MKAIPPSGKWRSGIQLTFSGWPLTLPILWPHKRNIKWALFGMPSRKGLSCANFWFLTDAGSFPGHSQQGGSSRDSLCKGSGFLPASLSHLWEISLPLHPEAQGSIAVFPALPSLNNSANSIRWSSDFLMFGQAVNIVILAHFNKYRQVWALVTFLQTRWWFFPSFSFLTGLQSCQWKQMCECYKISLLHQGFFNGFVQAVCQKTLQARRLSALHWEKLT